MEQAINIPKKTLLAHFKKGEGVTFTQYGLDMVVVERKQLNKVLKPKKGLSGMTEKQLKEAWEDYLDVKAYDKAKALNKKSTMKDMSLDDFKAKFKIHSTSLCSLLY